MKYTIQIQNTLRDAINATVRRPRRDVHTYTHTHTHTHVQMYTYICIVHTHTHTYTHTHTHTHTHLYLVAQDQPPGDSGGPRVHFAKRRPHCDADAAVQVPCESGHLKSAGVPFAPGSRIPKKKNTDSMYMCRWRLERCRGAVCTCRRCVCVCVCRALSTHSHTRKDTRTLSHTCTWRRRRSLRTCPSRRSPSTRRAWRAGRWARSRGVCTGGTWHRRRGSRSSTACPRASRMRARSRGPPASHRAAGKQTSE